ncbi:MAG: biopolymer transporter ExbD [Nevskia sp.]|nr:biopolymer transporter ExbD [Nevskia sp.]
MMRGLSRGTRRLSRRLRRKRATELNIVSMIDILTVLVFFLLVNATGVSILGINLPSSSSQPPQQLPRDLKIVIRTDGLTVADASGAIQLLPNGAAGYDLNGLAAVLGQIKDKVPEEDSIKLLLEPGINYDTLVKVMDVARIDPGGTGRQARELFPQISMGDAPPKTNGVGP